MTVLLRSLSLPLIRLLFKFVIHTINGKIQTTQPKHPKASVVFAALSSYGFKCGKLSEFDFLPTFCDDLRARGYSTHLVVSEAAAQNIISQNVPSILILVFGEDREIPNQRKVSPLCLSANAVYNSIYAANILQDKKLTNVHLASFGVPTPAIMNSSETRIFSNENNNSGANTQVIDIGEEVSKERYNTEFIDTTIKFEDDLYYTAVRLMCVDANIISSFVRARKVTDYGANAGVHSGNTPLHSELLSFLFDKLISPNSARFSEISQNIFEALGHGFYSHDLLVDIRKNQIYLCESGFKFDDYGIWRRMKPICEDENFPFDFSSGSDVGAMAAQQFSKNIETHIT